MKCLVLLFFLAAAPMLHAKQGDPKSAPGIGVDKKGRSSTPKSPAKPMDPVPAPIVMGSVTNWQAQAERMYPSLKSPDSSFSAAFEMACRLMHEQNPGFFAANDWPLRLAENVARSMKGDTTQR